MVWRAFFSLYLLLVAAVLAVGWGIDHLWRRLDPTATATAQDEALARLALWSIANGGDPLELSAASGRQLELLRSRDLAATPLAEQLLHGKPLAVEQADGRIITLWPLPDGDGALLLAAPPGEASSVLYSLLIGAFYACLGMAVLFWVVPLSRDLRRLEQQTRAVGAAAGEPVQLRPSSPLYDLATAFNGMAARIRSLIASHKEMTYGVSHELRTPLSRLKFGLAMLDQAPDPAERQRQRMGLDADIREMERLITELLAYAEFEQGETPLAREAGELKAFVESVIARLPSRDGCILTLAPTATELTVLCDWYLLERALVNLLQNAQRFARTRVEVSWQSAEGQVQLTVDDDGPGVPPEARERIFDSFVRLAHGANSNVRGFGLGLAIVRRIAQWHGGAARVETAPSGGARFVVRWPGVAPS